MPYADETSPEYYDAKQRYRDKLYHIAIEFNQEVAANRQHIENWQRLVTKHGSKKAAFIELLTDN